MNHNSIIKRYKKTFEEYGQEVHEALLNNTPVRSVFAKYKDIMESEEGGVFIAYKKYAILEEHFNVVQREAMAKIREKHPEFKGETIPATTFGVARMLMNQYLVANPNDPNDYDIPLDRRGELVDRFADLFQAAPEQVNEVANKIVAILVTLPSAKKLAEAIQACQPKRKSIREGLSGFSHLKLNGFSVGRSVDEARYFTLKEKGGVVAFSTEINATAGSGIGSRLTSWLESWKNRLTVVLKQFEQIGGFTIGNYVKGRYKADNGQIFDESSLSVEIIGINSDLLETVATEVSKAFKQQSVLVKDYSTGDIYLANPS